MRIYFSYSGTCASVWHISKSCNTYVVTRIIEQYKEHNSNMHICEVTSPFRLLLFIIEFLLVWQISGELNNIKKITSILIPFRLLVMSLYLFLLDRFTLKFQMSNHVLIYGVTSTTITTSNSNNDYYSNDNTYGNYNYYGGGGELILYFFYFSLARPKLCFAVMNR